MKYSNLVELIKMKNTKCWQYVEDKTVNADAYYFNDNDFPDDDQEFDLHDDIDIVRKETANIAVVTRIRKTREDYNTYKLQVETMPGEVLFDKNGTSYLQYKNASKYFG